MKRILSHTELSRICRGLSLLLHAGIGLGDGLFLLAEEDELRPLLTELGQKLDGGSTLSAAMESSGAFPVYAAGMVRVGEASGRMEEALTALADYYDERERLDRQIKNALLYPSVLLLLILAVIGVLLVRVLPVFDEVYASLGSRLTGVAGGLLRVGQALQAVMPLLCLLLAAAVVLVVCFSASAALRERFLLRWRRARGEKGLSAKLNSARFARALSMGLRSGLGAEDAAMLAGGLLQDVPAAAKRCETCAELLVQGRTLPQALRETETLPASACRMLEIGLQGGNGDQVMDELANRLAEEYTQELEHRTAQVEPAMVLTASLLVGMILLSVMLPLMHIMSAIG